MNPPVKRSLAGVNYLSTLLFALWILPIQPAEAGFPKEFSTASSRESHQLAQASLNRGRIRFELPNRGAPGNRFGGAARGGCQSDTKPLAALLPKTNLGLTMSDQPSFFLYLPKTSATAGEFLLTDTKGQPITKTMFSLPGTAGVIRVALPPQVASTALKPGNSYQWTFSLLCDPDDPSANSHVTGWIEWVAPNPALVAQLKQAPVSERPTLYANAGLWYETLAALADLRQTRPNDPALATDWSALLQSVGLELVAGEPLISCCSPTTR